MDDVTHALAGTLIARTHPSERKGLTLACVAGALIPDIDIVLTLWGKSFYVTEHRGFTHSLLGLAPMSFLAAGLAWLIVRKKKDRASFLSLWTLALLGVISHILLDWCTSWGTMILWPDRTRFALDHLFIIDLWYAACLALPLAAGFLARRHRMAFSMVGWGLVLGYHVLAAYNHHQALRAMPQEPAKSWVVAFPQPFSPFRWSVFAREDGTLWNRRLDLLKASNDPAQVEWKDPPLTPELHEVLDSPNGKRYLWFARVPVWEEEKQADGSFEVRFWDLRFQRSWDKDQAGRGFGTVFQVKDGRVTGGDI